MAAQYDWDWEGDEKDVGDDVGDTHGDELGEALTALRSGVWGYLVVVAEGMAFGESCDDDGDEGHD